MDINNFQRVGSESNTHAGNDFEAAARAFFAQQGISLVKSFSVPVGIGEAKKMHRFDLGSESPPVIVECKSHTWTQGVIRRGVPTPIGIATPRLCERCSGQGFEPVHSGFYLGLPFHLFGVGTRPLAGDPDHRSPGARVTSIKLEK